MLRLPPFVLSLFWIPDHSEDVNFDQERIRRFHFCYFDYVPRPMET